MFRSASAHPIVTAPGHLKAGKHSCIVVSNSKGFEMQKLKDQTPLHPPNDKPGNQLINRADNHMNNQSAKQITISQSKHVQQHWTIGYIFSYNSKNNDQAVCIYQLDLTNSEESKENNHIKVANHMILSRTYRLQRNVAYINSMYSIRRKTSCCRICIFMELVPTSKNNKQINKKQTNKNDTPRQPNQHQCLLSKWSIHY